MLNNANSARYFSLIHEDDQQDLFDCISMAHDFLEGILPEEHQFYRFIFHYRFKKPNGQFIYLHDEKATLNLRGAGNLYHVIFRDVTGEKPFAGVKVEFLRNGEFVHKIKVIKPASNRHPLSKREQELVGLIKQGLSTKEIAGHLSISHNTVRNIKSKLFEKYNVNNSIELLNMTG
jgi:DNA-binding CsgD family transcriptional regulator